MKIPSIRSPKGFTLVELLVVITIIMVLASAGFAAGNAAIQKARKATALATAIALESAVNNFFTEYGSMPKDGSTDTTVKTDSDTKFLETLLGKEASGAGALNTRGLNLLSVKEGKPKSNKNGLIYEGDSVKGLYDPWGGPYHVELDLDYDEKITPKPSAGGSTPQLNGRRVAVWSNGADGKNGGGKPTDDVKTWGN